jgi:hypothetical protein
MRNARDRRPACLRVREGILSSLPTGRALGVPLLAAALLATPAPAAAQASELAAKAAFIPRFGRYVSWPAAAQPGPRQPYVLCVVGRDPFGRSLDRAAARQQIDGRGIVVQRFASLEGTQGCHIAYVRGATAPDTERMLLALRERPVLTVTDSRAGPPRGIIHFTVAAGRVRFFIDEAEASARGIAISSRLLALALGVRQRRP